MKRHHWLLLLALLGLAVVLFAVLLFVTARTANAPAQPESRNLDDATLQVARNLYCPVCPNTPLDVCDTAACAQWRAQIKEKLAAGETPEQIEQYFVAQYGERVLGAPRPEGLNLTVYIAPVTVLAAGGIILFFAARRWVTRRPEPVSPGDSTEEYRDRVERELKELE